MQCVSLRLRSGLLAALLFASPIAVATLLDHGSSGQYFRDTNTGLFWYDPSVFVGQSRAQIDSFQAQSPIWRWATSNEIDGLLHQRSPVGVSLESVMGMRQFTLGDGGPRWIGFYAQETPYDGWLVDTYDVDESDFEIIKQTGHQGSVGNWVHGGWLVSEIDPGPSITIAIAGSNYVRSGNSESIDATFGGGVVNTAPKANTQSTLTYSGFVEVVVSGVGEALATSLSDAFYVYTNSVHNILTDPINDGSFYQLAIDTATIQGAPSGATPNSQLAKSLVVYDLDTGSETTLSYTLSYTPAYRADHTYSFVIDLSLTDAWTGDASTLNFTVANGVYDDNSGAYAINLFQLAQQQTGDAVLVQAIPNNQETRVIARVTGEPDSFIPTVDVLTSSSCMEGELGTDATVVGTLRPGVNTTNEFNGGNTFNANGDAYLGAVLDFAALDYVAARVGNSELSDCIVAGPDNDTWTRALQIPLNDNGPEIPSDGSATGFVDKPGTARWYQFNIQPGAKATIELSGGPSGLPADYDLAVFTDIGLAFVDLVGEEDVDGLNRLGAEFAPSAFSPSAFSPSAFSPSAFSPSAFSPSAFSPSAFSDSVYAPSAFSPSAFSPSAFSPSAFSPSAFSPSAFSPSAFSPSAFSPSAFSPSAFSAENYASAQLRTLVAVSAKPGTGTERIVADTWNNTGSFYVRVTGKNGAADTEIPFNLSVSLDGGLCNGVEPLGRSVAYGGGSPGQYDSIILWDSIQMASGLGSSDEEIDALLAKLNQLAARPEVNGVVVDLGAIADIQELHAQADVANSCPYAANLTATAIKEVIDTYRAVPSSDLSDLKYVVIAGSDGQIPFFRYPDQGLLGPEQDYNPPMIDGTQSQASLRLNYVLSQDQYGATTSLSLRDGLFPVPDLAVGRLVETVDEMINVIDAYLAAGGVVTPTSTLVTGYDFLQDAADAIQEELVKGTNNPATGTSALRNDTLISNAQLSPDESWNADQLRQALLGEGEDIVFLAGHFTANNTLAADYKTTMVVTELLDSEVDLTNSLIFSAGCHSGYNIVNGDIVPGLTLKEDWTQAFARKGASLIAGTGYQYGDTDFIEYSERLYLQFARELRTGPENVPVSIGQALVRAKQKYLATTPDLRGLHRKAVLISTVFGLPMLSIDMPGERIPDESGDPNVFPDDAPVDTPGSHVVGEGLFLSIADLVLSFSSCVYPATCDLIEQNKELDVWPEPPETSITQITTTYLSGADGVVTNPTEPAIPLKSLDVSVPMKSLRGVGFRGGVWSETLVYPLTGAAATELRGVHTPFASLDYFPMRLATPNYYGAIAGSDGTLLHVTPAQHRVANLGDQQAILRRFSNLDFRLFYSSNTQTYGDNRPALSAPPTMSGVRAVTEDVDGDTVNDIVFLANVVGDPAAGIQQVWVTYTEGDESSGEWQSLDLIQDPNDSRLWTGRLENFASFSGPLVFMAQAVNGVGLMTIDDNFGAFYEIAGSLGEVGADGTPDNLEATELTLTGPSGVTLPAFGMYGSEINLQALLVETGSGNLVHNESVLFTLGATVRSASTASGYASITLPLNRLPGDYTLSASFAGSTDLAASTDERAFEILKAGTTLTLDTGPQAVGVNGIESGVSAKLVDANGAPLLQRSVYFTVNGDNGFIVTVPAITDNLGRAQFAELTSTGSDYYEVTARFLGAIPTDTGDLMLDDPVYEPSSDTIYDSDGDGVYDDVDLCANTTIPESVPTKKLNANNWALTDYDFDFDTVVKGNGNGPGRSYTTADTVGCSCEQIIGAQGLGSGHTKNGCSIGAMDNWVEQATGKVVESEESSPPDDPAPDNAKPPKPPKKEKKKKKKGP